MGIEPTLFAWEARVLPLNDTRSDPHCRRCRTGLVFRTWIFDTGDGMKTVVQILMMLSMAMPMLVAAQACNDIKDKDKANYCRAIDTNDKSYCQKIGGNDLLNLCMGKVENDVKYCRRITTDKIKKRCENSIR